MFMFLMLLLFFLFLQFLFLLLASFLGFFRIRFSLRKRQHFNICTAFVRPYICSPLARTQFSIFKRLSNDAKVLTSDPLAPGSDGSFFILFFAISSSGLNDLCLTGGGDAEPDLDLFFILLELVSRSPDLLSLERSFLGGLPASNRDLDSFFLTGDSDGDLDRCLATRLSRGGGEGEWDSLFTCLLDDGLSGESDSDLGLRLVFSFDVGVGSGEDSLLERAFLDFLGGGEAFC